VSYESLVVSLKEKSKEVKKLENFKKKIEDRFREKVKECKDAKKDRTMLEEFIKTLFPPS
jgi:hypothetical protein